MAKKKKEPGDIRAVRDPFIPAKILSSRKNQAPAIPTEDPRHMTKIRLGTFSSEAFCKDPERRKELGLPPLPNPDYDFVDDLRS